MCEIEGRASTGDMYCRMQDDTDPVYGNVTAISGKEGIRYSMGYSSVSTETRKSRDSLLERGRVFLARGAGRLGTCCAD